MVDVAVLLSVGRHPVSGRCRRAPTDAQALEMALGLPGAVVHAVHAGDPDSPALRDYLGMGLGRLTVLALPPGADPVAPLVERLRRLRPALVLTGGQAEGGEDSGMVPYLVAQGLGAAVVPDVVSVESAETGVLVVQALPRGQRRAVSVAAGPVVVAINPAAPAARAVAYGLSRRGMIETVAVEAPADLFLMECEARPWRPRPKLMRARRGGSALDRLKAATESAAGKGQVLVDVTPEEAARAIYDSLLEQGVLP